MFRAAGGPDTRGMHITGTRDDGAHPAADGDRAAADLIDTWLHRGDPGIALRPALATRTAEGWTELTYGDLNRAVDRVAAWLAAQGVDAGARVAVVGEACTEWVIALFGVWRRGAIAVPLDPHLGADELGPIVARSRLSAVFVSGPWRDRATTAGVAVLDFGRFAGLPDGPDAGDRSRGRGDPALVVWTSGTTGAPKGATLSFANIAYVVGEGRAAHRLRGDDRWLSVLPLNHLLELSCGLLPALASGAGFAFAATTSPQQVAAAMAQRRFTRMTVVPLLLNALVHRIEEQCRRGRLRSAWFQAASGIAAVCLSVRMRRWLFAPVHRRLGGGRPTFHCGGAPLDRAIARRLELMGIPTYTGYGLTETAPTVSMNTPADHRPGSVGRPIPGTEVQVKGDGEIVVRSPGLMVGYWDDQALTRTVVDTDGWFHTGDLGFLDADGFLHVTGRAKALIVLPSGKKVQPEEVESLLATSTLLAESCVVGWAPPGRTGGSPAVCAAVVVAPELLARAVDQDDLRREAEGEVARLTTGLARFKRPGVVRVVAELPRTPKRSVRRTEVLRLLDELETRSAQGSGRSTAASAAASASTPPCAFA